MDIVELLNTADKLAQIINQKNQELDELKNNYNEKLQQINKYIDVIRGEPSSKESSNETAPIEDNDFVEQINKKLCCNNCDKELWNIENLLHSDFVLLPKHHIKYLLSKSGLSPSEHNQSKVKPSPISTPGPSSSTTPNAPYSIKRTNQGASNNKSKKTCSYCHKTGHSRARCFERLSKPT